MHVIINKREIEMAKHSNKIRKELNHLQEAGYLEKIKVDNKVEYKVKWIGYSQ